MNGERREIRREREREREERESKAAAAGYIPTKKFAVRGVPQKYAFISTCT